MSKGPKSAKVSKIAQGLKSRRQRQERIMEAASLVFGQNDYANVAIEEVAKSAKVARGTIYNHFGTKDQLYQEVLSSRLGALISKLEQVVEINGEPVHNLQRCVIQPFLFFIKYPNLYLIWKREELKRYSVYTLDNIAVTPSEKLSQKVSNARERLFVLIRGVIKNGVRLKIFKPMDPDVIVCTILGAIEGAAGTFIKSSVGSLKVRNAGDQLNSFVISSLLFKNYNGDL